MKVDLAELIRQKAEDTNQTVEATADANAVMAAQGIDADNPHLVEEDAVVEAPKRKAGFVMMAVPYVFNKNSQNPLRPGVDGYYDPKTPEDVELLRYHYGKGHIDFVSGE